MNFLHNSSMVRTWPDRRNLAQEAGNKGVAQLDGLRLGLCRIDCGLGELDLRHVTPRKDPIPKSLIGATSREVGSGFGKHRHILKSPKPLINMMYMAVA